MHYLRNQTENYCAEAKHTEQERRGAWWGRREGWRGRRQWIGVREIERRWERGKEDSPVQMCCWIEGGKKKLGKKKIKRRTVI